MVHVYLAQDREKPKEEIWREVEELRVNKTSYQISSNMSQANLQENLRPEHAKDMPIPSSSPPSEVVPGASCAGSMAGPVVTLPTSTSCTWPSYESSLSSILMQENGMMNPFSLPRYPPVTTVVDNVTLWTWKKRVYKRNPFRTVQIQRLFLKRMKREELLMVPALIIWMQVSQVNGQQIQQIPPSLLLQEGENFTMYCNSSSTLNSLQWYKQRPGGSPTFLMLLVSAGQMQERERLTARFGETRKHSSLHITAAQTADVGTYFCAGAQSSRSTCCLSPNLAVGSRSSSSLSLLRAGVRES
nr:uncharacterized protein LOC123275639 [Equus asinus]